MAVTSMLCCSSARHITCPHSLLVCCSIIPACDTQKHTIVSKMLHTQIMVLSHVGRLMLKSGTALICIMHTTKHRKVCKQRLPALPCIDKKSNPSALHTNFFVTSTLVACSPWVVSTILSAWHYLQQYCRGITLNHQSNIASAVRTLTVPAIAM